MLKAGGTLEAAMGKITDEFDENGQNSFAKKIAEAIKTPNQALNFKTEYDKFKKAVDDSVDIIDKALETNDLTELDTTNLKTVRSYLTETLATVDAAIKDSGLDKTNNNTNPTEEKLKKIQEGLNSDISKAAMETVLGDGTADGVVKSLTDAGGGLLKALADVKGKLTGTNKITVPKTDYEKVGTAITDIKNSIDKTLEAGSLTQLDTSNLKALRSSVIDLGKAFVSIEEMKLANGGNGYDVEVADFDKVKAAIDNITEASKEAGASATKALDSSKA